jgi:type VI secretion system secreted protein VgrG
MLVLVLVLPLLAVSAYADTPGIGDAGVYAVLGEAGVTNTGPSVIHGDVGGSIGTPSVGGFPPGTVVLPGVIMTGSVTAFSDATTAFGFTPGGTPTNLSGQNLGGLTLSPGVYTFSSTAQLSGKLTLDAGNNNNAQWVFQIGSGLNTASASSVVLTNAGGNGLFGGGITWEVGSAATLGTTTTFLGTIISNAGDTLATGATIGCGRVIALHASVTLDTNLINTPADCISSGGTGTTTGSGGTGGTGGTVTPPISPVPEPGTFALLSFGLVALLALRKLCLIPLN